MIIRIAGPADLDKITEIEAARAEAAGWGRAGFDTELKNKFAVIMCAEEEKEARGFICFRGAAGEGEILNFAVDKNYARKGFGAALITELKKYLKNAGFKKITLEVNENNIPAASLYIKEGFKTAGRRKKFYNNAQDALLMECKL